MSKEKQIEEMAKVMCDYYGTEKCYDCRYCCDCHISHEAERLWRAGYRKQSEGEWIEFPIDNYEGEPSGLYYVCSVCHEENGFEDKPFCPNCGAKMKGGE